MQNLIKIIDIQQGIIYICVYIPMSHWVKSTRNHDISHTQLQISFYIYIYKIFWIYDIHSFNRWEEYMKDFHEANLK